MNSDTDEEKKLHQIKWVMKTTYVRRPSIRKISTMAVWCLIRENLTLELTGLYTKEKACVASRKHLKRRSKGKVWKIDSGFYKTNCKPPLEMRILPRYTTVYKAAL